jgi:alkanesulfonate monooxygenase
VAVQPLYLHPYMAARMVSAIGALYGRRVDLNLVSGSTRPDLRAFGCHLDHDGRYDRLLAYGRVMLGLLRGADALTFQSDHYVLNHATIHPSLPAGLAPGVFVAGSSPACAAVARALHATQLSNLPRHLAEQGGAGALPVGIGLGIIARETSTEAWKVARTRFPSDPTRERFFESGNRIFSTHWTADAGGASEVYWTYPCRVAHREYAPYLVGSYDEVAAFLAPFLDAGVRSIVLRAARVADDLTHAMAAIRRAGAAC